LKFRLLDRQTRYTDNSINRNVYRLTDRQMSMTIRWTNTQYMEIKTDGHIHLERDKWS